MPKFQLFCVIFAVLCGTAVDASNSRRGDSSVGEDQISTRSLPGAESRTRNSGQHATSTELSFPNSPFPGIVTATITPTQEADVKLSSAQNAHSSLSSGSIIPTPRSEFRLPEILTILVNNRGDSPQHGYDGLMRTTSPSLHRDSHTAVSPEGREGERTAQRTGFSDREENSMVAATTPARNLIPRTMATEGANTQPHLSTDTPAQELTYQTPVSPADQIGDEATSQLDKSTPRTSSPINVNNNIVDPTSPPQTMQRTSQSHFASQEHEDSNAIVTTLSSERTVHRTVTSSSVDQPTNGLLETETTVSMQLTTQPQTASESVSSNSEEVTTISYESHSTVISDIAEYKSSKVVETTSLPGRLQTTRPHSLPSLAAVTEGSPEPGGATPQPSRPAGTAAMTMEATTFEMTAENADAATSTAEGIDPTSETVTDSEEKDEDNEIDEDDAMATTETNADSLSEATQLSKTLDTTKSPVAITTISTTSAKPVDATDTHVTMSTDTIATGAHNSGKTVVQTTRYDPCAVSVCQNGGTCHPNEGNFTCECLDGFEGEDCSIDIDDCMEVVCDNGGTCVDEVDGFICVCAPGWNGTNCTYNIDECSWSHLHDCSDNANCTDTNGSYVCQCHEGYTGDGVICAEIDECASDPCMNGATCLNKLSRYECRCTMGWNGTHCEQDIDECESGFAECDSKAECTNTDGSYSCQCRHGYRGDGYTCTEIMLYPYMNGNAETLTGDDVFTQAITYMEGFPFFGHFYTQFYVNMNGYISFEKPHQHSAPQKPFPEPAGQAILAPFWSDIDTTHGTGTLYYQSFTSKPSIVSPPPSSTHKSREMLDLVSRQIQEYFDAPDFNATYLFVATWHRASPYPSKTYADVETASFQVAIATDGNLSYTLFNYDLGGMLWNAENVEKRTAQVGYSDGGEHFYTVSQSFTRDVYQMDKVMGNSTGKYGRLAFDLNIPGQYNPNKGCYNWFNERPDLQNYIRASEPCPCSLQQARMDPRYKVTNGSFCAESVFLKEGTRQLCCYDDVGYEAAMSGALLTGFPKGGNIIVQSVEDFRMQGIWECCQRADFCHLVYQVFPSDDCSRYRPVASALSWGDPHLITLDNYKYTFNGMGEYTIVDVDNQFFVLQGRTEAAPSIDNDTTATVFTAFVAKQNDSNTLEVQHIADSDDVQIYINGEEDLKLSEIGSDQPERYSNVLVRQIDQKLHCTFSSGISVQIAASFNMLTTSVVLPESFYGQTAGLVGLWNGDMLDDFVLPNGTVLYPENGNFTDEELFTFGQMWQIQESDSLFTYSGGKNYSYYRNDDFQPLFFASIDEMFDGKDDLKNASMELCGDNVVCMFDIAATGNLSIGENTARAETTYNTEKEIRENYPPAFSNTMPRRLEITTDKDYRLTLEASDVNEDQITYAVWSNVVPQASVVGAEFSWTPSNTFNTSTPVVLYFTASDGRGAAIYNPDVWICNCQNGGNCTFGEGDNIQYLPSNAEGYYIADCNCAGGWNGRFCEEEIDGCLDYPCYPGVNCTDMPAGSAVEFRCGSCPQGMVGDGIKCFDENECLTSPGLCNHTCVNTLGSYYCECLSGFQLSEDRHSCDDIDECTDRRICARYATCINLPGSFDCQCAPEYHGSGFVKCIEAVKYGATLVFPYLEYGDDLEDRNSGRFKELAEKIEASLNKTYKILNGFIGAKVVKFEDGSVVSHSELAFDVDTSVGTEDVESTLEDAIQCDGSICYMNNEEVPGFEIDRALSHAGDLNECSLDVDDCHPESTMCVNLNGTFTCECRHGWRQFNSPKMCEDIDECSETLNCTSPNTVCVNQPGGFTCNCQVGHVGDPLSAGGCTNICNSDPCLNGGTCTAIDNGFTCVCVSGYVGLTCTEEDPELKKLKWIAIVVGGIAGFLLIALAITLLVVCCKRKKVDVPTPRQEDVDELLWSSGYQPGLLRASLHESEFEKLELEQQNANRREPVVGEHPGDVELRYQPIHYPTGIYTLNGTTSSTDYPLENGAGPSRLGTEYF